MTEQFLTESQLAERWNLSLSTVQKYRNSGKNAGPAFVQIGPITVRYRMEDVIEYENARTMGGYIAPQARRALLRHAQIFEQISTWKMTDAARSMLDKARGDALSIANNDKIEESS